MYYVRILKIKRTLDIIYENDLESFGIDNNFDDNKPARNSNSGPDGDERDMDHGRHLLLV